MRARILVLVLLVGIGAVGFMSIADNGFSRGHSASRSFTSTMTSSSEPAEVLRKAIETYDSGDSETAGTYMTDDAKKQVYFVYRNFDTVLGVWKEYGQIKTDVLNRDKPMKIRLAYDRIKVTGLVARVPWIIYYDDGSPCQPFRITGSEGFKFVLVCRDGEWLLDRIDIDDASID